MTFTNAIAQKFPDIEAAKGEPIFIFPKGQLAKISGDENADFIVPLFKNSDVHKYVAEVITNKELLYTDGEKQLTPGTLLYLERFKPILKAREEFRDGRRAWYNLHRARASKIFNGPKIVAPYRSTANTFAYNETPFYAATDVYFMTAKGDVQFEPFYLLGVLNSRLIYAWLYYRGKRKGQMLELLTSPLSEIPIVVGTSEQKQTIEKIVREIIAVKTTNPQADTTAQESQIDQLVYQLYNLTPEEIKIVEGK